MKHLTLFFAFGALLFLSCQTVSARGVKIPFGDREVLNKVADLPDTEEYKTDNGNYIDLGTIHQEFNIAYILPLYIEQEPRLVGYCEKEDTYYELTEEGRKTLSYFEKDISQDIRNEVKEYLESCGCRVQERILTPADYYTTPQGGYAVRCQIIERDSTIMDLSMAAPGKEAAQAICRSWASKSQDIYEMLMSELIS